MNTRLSILLLAATTPLLLGNEDWQAIRGGSIADHAHGPGAAFVEHLPILVAVVLAFAFTIIWGILREQRRKLEERRRIRRMKPKPTWIGPRSFPGAGRPHNPGP